MFAFHVCFSQSVLVLSFSLACVDTHPFAHRESAARQETAAASDLEVCPEREARSAPAEREANR